MLIHIKSFINSSFIFYLWITTRGMLITIFMMILVISNSLEHQCNWIKTKLFEFAASLFYGYKKLVIILASICTIQTCVSVWRDDHKRLLLYIFGTLVGIVPPFPSFTPAHDAHWDERYENQLVPCYLHKFNVKWDRIITSTGVDIYFCDQTNLDKWKCIH